MDITKTVYIAGKISGNLENYNAEFQAAEDKLRALGFEKILKPSVLPGNLGYEQYMPICFAMIDVSDYIYFLDNWQESSGALREFHYAYANKVSILNAELDDEWGSKKRFLGFVNRWD